MTPPSSVKEFSHAICERLLLGEGFPSHTQILIFMVLLHLNLPSIIMMSHYASVANIYHILKIM